MSGGMRGCNLLLLSGWIPSCSSIFMLSNTHAAAAAAAGWSPRLPWLIHTDVAWPCVATVTHSHQQLQHLMNIN